MKRLITNLLSVGQTNREDLSVPGAPAPQRGATPPAVAAHSFHLVRVGEGASPAWAHTQRSRSGGLGRPASLARSSFSVAASGFYPASDCRGFGFTGGLPFGNHAATTRALACFGGFCQRVISPASERRRTRSGASISLRPEETVGIRSAGPRCRLTQPVARWRGADPPHGHKQPER